MTTLTYKTLEPFKERLGYAKRLHYARFDRQEQAIFFQCYKDTFGTELTRSQKACPHCMLQACSKLYDEMLKFETTPAGKKYLKAKREEEENAKEETNADA